MLMANFDWLVGDVAAQQVLARVRIVRRFPTIRCQLELKVGT